MSLEKSRPSSRLRRPKSRGVDHRRLVSLVFTLGLVGISFQYVSQPRAWYWLTGKPAAREVAKPRAGRTTELPRETDGDVLKHDAVRIAALSPFDRPASSKTTHEVAGTAATHGVAEETLPASAGTGARPVQSPGEVAAPGTTATAKPSDGEPGAGPVDPFVPREILNLAVDDVVGVREREVPVYRLLLLKAQQVPLSVLEKLAGRQFTANELLNDAPTHRGRILTLQGNVRRFRPLDTTTLGAEIPQMYEGWLFTKNDGASTPYRVICIDKPTDFPEGEIHQEVEFTGYFFKVYRYPTQFGMGTAPMLIGKRFRWSKTVMPRTSETSNLAWYAIQVLLAGILFSVGSIAYLNFTDQRRKRALADTQISIDPSLDSMLAAMEPEPPVPELWPVDSSSEPPMSPSDATSTDVLVAETKPEVPGRDGESPSDAEDAAERPPT